VLSKDYVFSDSWETLYAEIAPSRGERNYQTTDIIAKQAVNFAINQRVLTKQAIKDNRNYFWGTLERIYNAEHDGDEYDNYDAFQGKLQEQIKEGEIIMAELARIENNNGQELEKIYTKILNGTENGLEAEYLQALFYYKLGEAIGVKYANDTLNKYHFYFTLIYRTEHTMDLKSIGSTGRT
jgi:hypothetical protein